MIVGCPVTSSAFSLHKTMNNELNPNPNPNLNLNLNPNLNTNSPIQRQMGIVSLDLGSDTKTTTNHHSIKRTLSADMSSPNWLQNNGLSSPMKRSQSSDKLNAPFEEQEQQLNKQIIASKDDHKKCAFEDIWNSILISQNGSGSSSGSGNLPHPYVHPTVKRTSSLSEKSLEICTESLGSETGSDGYSFPVSSEHEDTEKGSETIEDQHVENVNESPIFEPNDEVDGSSHMELTMDPMSPTLSSGPRVRSSFPPPLPSLANRDGSNVQMTLHRQNGRLVLEAVAVPSQNCLKAQRHDGRLLLTFVGDKDDVDDYDVGLEDDVLELDNDDEFQDIECCEEYQEIEQEGGYKVEEGNGSCLNSPMEMINVQQATSPALIMSKFKWLSTTRSRNVNVTIINDRSEVDQQKPLLPPRPKNDRVVSTDGSISIATSNNSVLNGYEYYWRQSATAMAMLKPLASQQNVSAAPQVVGNESNYMSKLLFGHNTENPYTMGQEKQEVVVVKAIGTRTMQGDQREKEGEYLVPFLRGCKESKRSLLLWGPHCIATS